MEAQIIIAKKLIVLLTMAIALLQQQQQKPPKLGAITPKLGAVGLVEKSDILDAVATTQTNYFNRNGRYYYSVRQSDPDLNTINIDSSAPKTWVHAYQAPNNKHGYQVFFSWNQNGQRHLKSVGYGAEASLRTFEEISPLGVASSTVN